MGVIMAIKQTGNPRHHLDSGRHALPLYARL